MPGSITPLPIMLEEEDRRIYENLEPPKSIVIRYGYQKKVAELPYDGEDKPGCGSKLVVRTERGMELAEMLTTTCPNSGCGKSVSRKQMLQYVENSGGKDFPFSTQGKVLRVATMDDVAEQAHLDATKPEIIKNARSLITELGLPMKLVEVERLLGGERIVFYYTAEQWVDFRELVRKLASEYHTRIEMMQVNAREEARLVADYERCGQYCCCKGFLKVLKPVSMRSAKVQKATLDPQKISGRCGRLMCCLRYEDETYEDLRRRLPNRKTRVMTPDGPGSVLSSQILTQLVLVLVDSIPKPAAYPLENLEILPKDARGKAPQQPQQRDQQRGQRQDQRGGRSDQTKPQKDQNASADQSFADEAAVNDDAIDDAQDSDTSASSMMEDPLDSAADDTVDGQAMMETSEGDQEDAASGGYTSQSRREQGEASDGTDGDGPRGRKKRRRRRRRRKGR